MELKDDRRFHHLTQEQVETLDQVLTEVIPIHGRGNFPTLEIKPKDIIHVVRDRLVSKHIKVRDVRLNGSTASHVLVKENGTSYKDLDIIFGVELPKQEDFQIIKEVVLGCLLDFLPRGVNKDKITALTMKEAYVQKMVKVFTEHDRWSLISLCNNSGKNVELKFVSSLRRQFEFSVDSFQIILDSMLESYLEAERQEAAKHKKMHQEQDSSQTPGAGLHSGESRQQIFAHTENSDIDMTDETKDMKDMNTVHDLECNSLVMDGQNTESIEKTLETTHEHQPEEIGDSKMIHDVLPTPETITDEKKKTIEIGPNSNLNSQLERLSQTKSMDTPSDAHAEVLIEISVKDETVLVPLLDETKHEHKDSSHEPMHTCEPIVPTERSTNATFQSLSEGAFLSVDSNEFSLPPPAKKNTRTSQMVVLKHSSPKPPRKMSRKIMSSSKSSQLQSVNVSDPKPMQVDMPGVTTNCVLSAMQDQNASSVSEESTTIPRENGTHCEKMQSLPPDKSTQMSEPDAGDLTKCSFLSSSLEPLISTENETQTNLQQTKPVIQVNSQPVPEVDDVSSSCLNSSTKEESVTLIQEDSLETLMDSSFNTNIELQTSNQDFVLPFVTPQVPQEPPVVYNPSVESSVSTSHLIGAPILLTQPQDFPQTTEILSPCLLEPLVSSESEDLSIWPSESSTYSTPESSVISIPSIDPPIAFPEMVEPLVDLVPSETMRQEPQTTETLDKSLKSTNLPDTQAQNVHREVPSVTVIAESMYGDFEQAMDHLRYRLIATRNPEEIRGGGLLKYSNLLVRDFKPASETEIKTLERYMCSRFFIDFPDVNEQQRKIESYLRNHFIGEEKSKYDYLMTLRRVVNESTVCLMGHERRQTLNMITILALKVLGEQNIIPNTNNVTCYYQPAPYMTDHNFSNYYIANGQSPLIYHPYPLHIHMQTGLV